MLLVRMIRLFWLLGTCVLVGVGFVAVSPAFGAVSTSLPTWYELPNGWVLEPAGTQVLTQREPTGLAVAPNGSAVYTVSSGVFDEGIAELMRRRLTSERGRKLYAQRKVSVEPVYGQIK